MANMSSTIIKKTSSAIGKVDKMELFGLGMGAYFGYQEYKSQRERGNSTLSSVAGGVGDFLVSQMAPVLYPTAMALAATPKLVAQGAMGLNKLSRSMNRERSGPFSSATFVDTKQSYTMRQAGMQLAENSKYNLQQTLLGREASIIRM